LLTNSGRRSCADPIPRLAGLDRPGLLRHGMERDIEKRLEKGTDLFLRIEVRVV